MGLEHGLEKWIMLTGANLGRIRDAMALKEEIC